MLSANIPHREGSGPKRYVRLGHFSTSPSQSFTSRLGAWEKAFSECTEEDSALHRGRQLFGLALNCINTQAKSQAWLERPRELVACQHL